MPVYEYKCKSCNFIFEVLREMSSRDKSLVCAKCGQCMTERMVSMPSIIVPEGGCGNAANGYSSTHGDSELFKAKGTEREKKVKEDFRVS